MPGPRLREEPRRIGPGDGACVGPESKTTRRNGRRCVMFVAMLVLGLVSAWAVTASVIQFRRDGYHRMRTLAH
ncbi:hypothetical protein GCM10009819_13950 [Agromyces tropicus]|uniref:Uncharacterized protein n=1 Tax=Agromyces tropicus TaxID=555371 RepID=A0ABP5FSQ5_9MICO